MENIGVKFCGQCNSWLRLREVYDSLEAIDNENNYSFYKEDGDHDKVLILCGCTSECANISKDISILKVHPEPSETAENMASRILKVL